MTQSFEFGEYRLELEERRLFFRGQERSLPTKVFDTLALLVQRPSHLITKDEFLNLLWPGTFVGEDTLAQNISLLRKALSQGANGQEYIATVPRRGYRFVAQVTAKPVVGQAVSESGFAKVTHSGDGQQATRRQDVIPAPPGPTVSQRVCAPILQEQRFRLGWMSVLAVSTIVGFSAGVATFLVLRRQTPIPIKALSFVQLTNNAHPWGPLRTDGTRI